MFFSTRRCYVAKKLFFSDELFQAQQAQHTSRWASEDVVSVLMMESMESDSSVAGPSQVMVQSLNVVNHPGAAHQIMHPGITNGLGTTACRNDFFPVTSPPSTISESSGSVMAGMDSQRQLQQKCVTDVPNNGPVENTGLFGFPEYKH